MAIDERYARQRVLPQIGEAGQQRLLESRVLLIGCGALGCVQADLLARAGVGTLRIADRDLVERTNLQRQTLFDEQDAADERPKAEAAARRLRAVNSGIRVEPLVMDVSARNIEALVADADLVLDATDNVETRYALNDACVKLGRPWIYGGAVATSGLLMTIRPGEGPCLRCLFPEPAPPGTLPTCDLAGVLNSTTSVVAALQVAEAVKLLTGNGAALAGLLAVELWPIAFRTVNVQRDPQCPCCGRRRFDYLAAASGSLATSLCGRNAVQVSPAQPAALDLAALAERLRAVGDVRLSPGLLRVQVGEQELFVFGDGRAIVKGTDDVGVARSLVSRYIGA